MRKSVAVGTIVVVVVAIGAAGFCVDRHAEGRWQEMLRTIAAFRSELTATNVTRPPLYGDAVVGKAMQWYAEALELAADLRADDAALLRQLAQRPESLDAMQRDELLDRWQPALERVVAGTHAADVGYELPQTGDEAARGRMHSLLLYRDLTNLLVGHAVRELSVGRDVGAVEATLDGLMVGIDLMRSPLLVDQMMGCAVVEIAGAAAWTDERLRALSPAGLQRLADGLAVADGLLEPGLDLRGEVVWVAESLVAAGGGFSWAAWTHAFAGRWLAADAVLRFADAATRLRIPSATWSERRATIERTLSGFATGNALATIAMPNLLAAEPSQRGVIAALRLLRLHVAYRLEAPMPDLVDPLGGGELEADDDGGAVVFKSAGERGGKPIERRAAAR